MEKYLRRCLGSLVVPDEKLFETLEVLVVNDGSKDASSSIAHEYQDMFPKVFRVIDKENGNYGSCVNCGLKEATGKYIKILDADDSFNTVNFEKYLAFLQQVDVDLVLTDFQQVNENGKVLFTWQLKTSKECLEVKDIDPLYMQMHSVTYKTKNIKGCNYVQSEGISYTDTEWMFLPILTVKQIKYYSKVIYKYLVGREGQTIDEITVAKRIEQIIYILKRMLAQYDTIQNKNKDVDNYLIGFIKRLLVFAYHTILISGKCKVNTIILSDFDKWLQTNYSFYMSLEQVKAHPFLNYYYIKDWRDHSYNCLNKFQLQKLSVLNRLEQMKISIKNCCRFF